MAGLYNQDDWMRNLIQISIVYIHHVTKKIIIFCVVKWINKHKNNKNTCMVNLELQHINRSLHEGTQENLYYPKFYYLLPGLIHTGHLATF